MNENNFIPIKVLYYIYFSIHFIFLSPNNPFRIHENIFYYSHIIQAAALATAFLFKYAHITAMRFTSCQSA